MSEPRSEKKGKPIEQTPQNLLAKIEQLQTEIQQHQGTIDRVLEEVPNLEEKWDGVERLLREGSRPLAKTRWANPETDPPSIYAKHEVYGTRVDVISDDEAFILDLLISRDYFTPGETLAKTEVQKRREIIVQKQQSLAKKRNEFERIRVEAAIHGVPRPPLSSKPPEAKERYVFRREKGAWIIAFGADVVHLEDRLKGLHYIDNLLQNSRSQVSVLVLASITEKRVVTESAKSSMSEASMEEEGLVSSPGLQAPIPDSDQQTFEDCKVRLQEIREAIEEAKEFGNLERVAGLEEEEEKIKKYLSSAFGLGGKPRRVGPKNQIRLNLTKAIRRAIDKIAVQSPALASHLQSSIKTGYQCSYYPAGEIPSWKF